MVPAGAFVPPFAVIEPSLVIWCQPHFGCRESCNDDTFPPAPLELGSADALIVNELLTIIGVAAVTFI